MKNIAYILLSIAILMTIALLIGVVVFLFSIGMKAEKVILLSFFLAISCFGLIGRVIFVIKDSRK